MSKKIYLRTKITILLTLLTFVIIITYSISNISYALNNYTITFNRAEGTEIMKKCITDVNGLLTTDCINEISKVCSKWSLTKCKTNGCVDDNQNDYKTIEQLKSEIFSADTNYYCKGGSSQPNYNKGCYICKDDNTIVKWGFNTDADSNCVSGYTKDSTKSEEECVVNACYVCKTDETILEWRTNDISDDKCPNGYDKTNKSETECVYVEEPKEACYICKTDETILEWRTNDIGDDKCPNGYDKTNKSETECVYIEEPKEACYICKTDETILEWRNNGDSDDKCPSGYNETDRPEAKCKFKNPPTGSNELIYNLLLLMVVFLLVFVEIYLKRKEIKI